MFWSRSAAGCRQWPHPGPGATPVRDEAPHPRHRRRQETPSAPRGPGSERDDRVARSLASVRAPCSRPEKGQDHNSTIVEVLARFQQIRRILAELSRDALRDPGVIEKNCGNPKAAFEEFWSDQYREVGFASAADVAD